MKSRLFVLLPLLFCGHGNSADVQLCTSCHGNALQGDEQQTAPLLAGREAWFLAEQMRAFKKGWRGTGADQSGAAMRAIAMTLDEKTINALSAEVAAMPAPAPKANPNNAEITALAAPRYNAVCSACHGSKAQGNKRLKAPALGALSESYLLAQINKFRQGIRGAHPDDKAGAQMRRSAANIADDKEAQALAQYIRQLSQTP
ncbi:c-type cytochrome [Permianibacter aggregans]|uniref:Cytochrome c553 n=1 Tax=Permianibacter aggregans TaxID=1510150 RepID=A0A4R6UUK3_9GAMM|nr:c-type cytochrome [Permianibacter aggregans]QGX39720.1 c-type cytochrome [Permianibacter aggregans]TDQ47164.1 cytochrome c553 [Permianibacter aggregans]